MVSTLNKIWMGTYRLRVFLANKGEKGTDRDRLYYHGKTYVDSGNQTEVKMHENFNNRSFADVVKTGRKIEPKEDNPNQQVLGEWEADKDTLEYLQECAVMLERLVRKLQEAMGWTDATDLAGCWMNCYCGLLGSTWSSLIVFIFVRVGLLVDQVQRRAEWTVFAAMGRLVIGCISLEMDLLASLLVGLPVG
ncbi:hypothetical protein L6452_40811 [Arctium lappa]|uniref:Uncharacterized protein n=1 Tax=Arctium lappa TaxID=4217 RepID=A0ACB8XMB1_ARCLA|nr:hypothetical protein L6452_40811 [Arctium lappa]